MAKSTTARAAVGQRTKTNADYTRNYMAKAACIGPIRDVVDPERRESCRLDLLKFLMTYLMERYPSPFSAGHKKFINDLQSLILFGGDILEVVFRGFGKSALMGGAAIWAASYGHREFVPLLSTGKSTAAKSMQSIKTAFESNALLAEDFPEICQPIKALEGISQRAAAQTYVKKNGEIEHTHIEWKQEEIVLPQIEDSPSSGVALVVYGIDSRKARGLNYTKRGGSIVRPDIVIIDDPQDRKIAKNPTRVANLRDQINADILMGGGHFKRIASLICATMIEPNDLIAQLMDDPAWVTTILKMLVSPSKHEEDYWLTKYRNLRLNYEKGNKEDKRRAEREATEDYIANRSYADEGAEVTWEHCYNEQEVSAIQHAYNIMIDRGIKTFQSECQNDPIDPTVDDEDAFAMADLRAKLTRLPRGVVPATCARVTAFIDVADRELQWVICAFGDGYTGSVIDYGIHKIKRPKGMAPAQAIVAALGELEPKLSARMWQQDGLGQLKTSKVLIDSGNGNYSEVIYAFVKNKRDVFASRGRYVKPDQRFVSDKIPLINQYFSGNIYIAPPPEGKTQVPLVQFDANEMKSFAWNCLRTAAGGVGCVSFFGTDAEAHRTFWEHTQSEYKQKLRSEKTKKVFDLWQVKPGNPPNHFWDGYVGCIVGAALERIPTSAEMEARKFARQIVRNPDMAAAAAGAAVGMRHSYSNSNAGGIRRTY